MSPFFASSRAQDGEGGDGGQPGETALHMAAAMQGNSPCVRLLLEAGADVSAATTRVR